MVELLLAFLAGAFIILLVALYHKSGQHSRIRVTPSTDETPARQQVSCSSTLYRTATKQLPHCQPADAKLGDLQEAFSYGSLHDYLLKKHEGGRISVNCFWWREKQVVSVCGPRGFRDTEHLYNRPVHVFGPFFEPLHGSKSIQSINDKEWEERKRIVHANLRGRNIDEYFDNILQVAEETLAKWRPGEKICLNKEMFRITLKSILNTSLLNIFSNDNELDCLANTYDRCRREMDRRILDVPPLDSEREVTFQKDLTTLQSSMKSMLQFQREHKNARKSPLMDAFLSSNLPEEYIICDMITVMGGFHTSSFFLTWLFHYLAQHQGIQETLVQDIREHVQDDNFKTYCLTSSTYLRQVVDEALRMSTTSPFSGHYSNDDLVVDGYHIPAKTPIIHAMGVTLMDEAIWDDPKTFKPDRFSPGSSFSKRKHEFRPFGVSVPRRCPANQFMYAMASIFLSVLLQRFIIVPASEHEGEDEKIYGFATYPKGDISIEVQYRQ